MKIQLFTCLLGSMLSHESIAHIHSFHNTFSGKNHRLCLNLPVDSAVVGSPGRNYILTRTFRVAGVSEGSFASPRPVGEENVSIQYLDGLGRPVQGIIVRASPAFRDIVQHMEYDSAGRQTRRYLPYAAQGGTTGSYRTAAKASQLSYYSTGNTWDGHVKKTAYPYSETIYEGSPLGRVIEQGAPGAVWQSSASRATSTGRTFVTEYGSNTATGSDAVKLWRMGTSGASSSGNYGANKLYRTTLKDENWVSGKAGTVDEYRNGNNQLVLNRVWKSESEALDTYYIYDAFNQLRYVVPPAVTGNSFQDGDAVFQDYVYAYRYDGRKRLVEKKIPGKGWEYMVYNRADQLVLVQDAEQRLRKEWSYSRYDNLGRAISTGLYTNTSQTTLTQIRSLVENFAGPLWEERKGAAIYANTSFPVAGANIAIKPLTVTYYDDYNFTDAGELPAEGITPSVLAQTLVTGTVVYQVDGTLPLLSVYYYDDKGRTVQTASQNHLGGTDYVTNTYSFADELLASTHDHRASGSGPVTTVLTSYTYDHVGRLVDTRKKVNGQTEVIQSRLVYNEIGQLKQKRLHSEDDGSSFINTIDYLYNERGWATRISSPHFTEELSYQQPSLGTTEKQYNGNISEQLWGHGTTGTPNRFVYTYDKLGRLTKGTSTGTVMHEEIAYDNIGNITTLERDSGPLVNYTYEGNHLLTLSGGITAYYNYDANGNSIMDRTGMAFTYNFLNLPATAAKSGTSISFTYDALGNKLAKRVMIVGATTQRHYIQGIEYYQEGSGASVIDLIRTEEGYLQNNGGAYTYLYNLTDHLGNVRATLQRTSPTMGTVIQKHDYYPFGHAKALVISGLNKYLYNGKELQDELGQYDYGARLYDPVIGRWNVVDPLAEEYFTFSPYAYVGNDPILFRDANGMYRVDETEILPYTIPTKCLHSSIT